MDTSGGPSCADEHLVQRFTTATQRLATSADVLAEALQLLRMTRPSFQRTVALDAGDDTSKERLLFALVLFVAQAGRGREGAPSATLSDVLRALDTTLVDFFRHLPTFLADADKGSDLTRRYGCHPGDKVQLTKLQKHLTFSFVLSEKYRRTFKVFLKLSPEALASSDPGDDALARVGWHLFCLAKQAWLGTFSDLSALAHLLVAVLAVLIAHAPAERLVSPFDNITQFPQRAAPPPLAAAASPPARGPASRSSGGDAAAAASHSQPADVVGSLCAQSKTEREPVQMYVDRLAMLVADVLPHKPPLVPWDTSRTRGGGPDTCLPVGPSRLPGLIPADDSHVAAVADALGVAYDELMRQHKAEIDERDFLGSRLDNCRDVPGGHGGGGQQHKQRVGAGLTGNPALLTPRQSGRFDKPPDGQQPRGGGGGTSVLPPLHLVVPLGDPVPPTGLVPPGAAAGTPFRGMASPAQMIGGGAGGGTSHGVVAVSTWLRSATSLAPGETWAVTDNCLAMEPPSATLGRILGGAQSALQGAPGAHIGGLHPAAPMTVAALYLSIQKKANSYAAAVFPALPADGGPVGSQAQALAAPVRDVLAGPGNAVLDAPSLRQHLVVLFMRMLDRVLLREEKRQAARAAPGANDTDAAAAAAAPDAAPVATPDLSALLQSEAFLRALACACAELLLRATELHGQPQFLFPASCAAVHCSPLEVCPLLVSVIEADPNVPRELQRHLNTLSEHVLEVGGWERGSRLFDYLSAMQRRASLAVRDAAARAARFPPGSLPTGISAVSEAAVAPAVGDVSLSPEDQQQVAAAAGAEALVRGFVSQVMTLASLRLQKLADKLNFPDTLRAGAVAAFEYALHDCTQLFYGRHLDQGLLCVLYGAAKAAEWPRREEPLLFRDIIGAYRAVYRRDRGVPAPEAIYRRVPMAYPQPVLVSLEAPRYDDVIKFYNSVFVPCMKPFLLRSQARPGRGEPALDTDTVAAGQPSTAPGGAAGGEATPGRQARRSPFRVLPLSATPRRMGAFATHSVMVSPLRGRDDGEGASGGGGVVAARSGSLYAFLGESSQALQSPGRDLEYINARVAASGFAHTPSLLVDAAAAAAAAAAADAFTGVGLAGLGARDMGPPSPIAEGDEEEAAAALMGASSQGDLAAAAGDLPGMTPNSSRRRPAAPGMHEESPNPQRRRL